MFHQLDFDCVLHPPYSPFPDACDIKESLIHSIIGQVKALQKYKFKSSYFQKVPGPQEFYWAWSFFLLIGFAHVGIVIFETCFVSSSGKVIGKSIPNSEIESKPESEV